MTRKLTGLIAGLFASLALLAGTMQGCGGSDSGSGFSAACSAGCDKVMMCGATADQVSACRAECTSTAGMHCTNEAAITAAIKSCTAMTDCAAAIACSGTIPSCQTSGTGGSGGTSGGGGAGGANAADCATCTKFDACCVAFGAPATQCTAGATCTAAPAAMHADYNTSCQTGLTALAMQANAPAVCQ